MKKEKRRLILWLSVAGIFAALCLVYAFSLNEPIEMTPEQRIAWGGDYIELSEGFTHYELCGPESGELVVLVHGTTVPMWDFDAQMATLTNAGYRVLRYDEYGRGYSDRPRVRYNRRLYRKQLEELIEALKIEEPFSLMGHSFGGALVSDYAVKNPEKVGRLMLFAPVVHLVDKKYPFRLARVPLLGPLMVRLIYKSAITSRANRLFKTLDEESRDYYHDLFVEQTRVKGFEHAMYSMFVSSTALRNYEEVYEKLGETDIPVTLVWGSEDDDISREDVNLIQKAVPMMSFVFVEGAGHSMNVSASETFNDILLSWLSGKFVSSEVPGEE